MFHFLLNITQFGQFPPKYKKAMGEGAVGNIKNKNEKNHALIQEKSINLIG